MIALSTVMPGDGRQHGSPLLQLLACLMVVNTLVFFLWAALASGPTAVVGVLVNEWGILESVQSLLLAAAAVLCFVSAASHANDSAGSRHIRRALGLFFVILLLREFAIDQIGTSPHWETFETVLRLFVALVAVVYALYLLPQCLQLLSAGKALLGSGLATLLIAGVVFYVLGWPFDKQVFAVGEGLALLMEELLELNACIAFYFAARLIETQESAAAVSAA